MKLIVCDPACVQPFGHNVVALKYFRDAFSAKFEETHALSCNELPTDICNLYNFKPFFKFYYDGYIQSPNHIPMREQDILRCPINYVDPLEWVATEDAKKLLVEFSTASDDVLLFPHLDFYGVAGAINALLAAPVDRRPRLYLRFIGVMENASSSYRDPTTELIHRIRRAKERGLKVVCSAETPRLADYLAVLLGDAVSVTPYPDFGAPMPLPTGDHFVFFCPGSARLDKGFLRLAEIFAKIRMKTQDLKIRFITQTLPFKEAKNWSSYTSTLYAIPGVEVYEPMISETEMLNLYRRASALLLPYDTEIYERRGSAAMMEGISFGRPVITLEGSAFADQVRYYGCGVVVSSIDEMVRAAIELANVPKDTLKTKVMQSNFRFTNDVKQSYNSWLAV